MGWTGFLKGPQGTFWWVSWEGQLLLDWRPLQGLGFPVVDSSCGCFCFEAVRRGSSRVTLFGARPWLLECPDSITDLDSSGRFWSDSHAVGRKLLHWANGALACRTSLPMKFLEKYFAKGSLLSGVGNCCELRKSARAGAELSINMGLVSVSPMISEQVSRRTRTTRALLIRTGTWIQLGDPQEETNRQTPTWMASNAKANHQPLTACVSHRWTGCTKSSKFCWNTVCTCVAGKMFLASDLAFHH